MKLVNDALLGRLRQRRLTARWAHPTAPDGERRSKESGAGMEFADHRDYQPGDDLRHLDAHAYSRLRRPYVKVFAGDRGLDVAILLDTSASMNYGQPSKLRVAAELAAALAYVGIASGDRVRLGTFGTERRIAWRPVVSSVGHISALVNDLDRQLPADGGETDLKGVAVAADSVLPAAGLTVVLSDWWTAAPEQAVRAFARSGRELVIVQVLAPEEEDPGLLDEGWTRLVDAEGGESLDLSLGADVRGAYLRSLDEWRERLETEVERVRGRYLRVRSDRPTSEVLLGEWREAGFVR